MSALEATYQTVRVDIAGPVITVTLARPEARNALDRTMCDELAAVAAAASTDDRARVVVFGALPPVFCAGADLKERQGMDAAGARDRRLAAYDAYAAIEAIPVPTIAVVEGPAVGSGCEIACACDLLLATTEATFRYPEVGWGTIGATQRLPRRVGLAVAKELLLTGRRVAAEEAGRLGLVNRVVAPAQLEAALDEWIEPIVAAPPLAVRLAKATIDAAVLDARRRALVAELAAIDEVLAAADWRERIDGFDPDPRPEPT